MYKKSFQIIQSINSIGTFFNYHFFSICFNQTTSLITFSVSVICFAYLLYNGIKKNNKYDVFAGIMTILIGSMQLIEFFLWGNQRCYQENHFFSLSIMFLLYLQTALASIVYFYLFETVSIGWILGSMIGIYTAFTAYLLTWLNKQQLCSKPMEGSCRLVWAPFHALRTRSHGILLSTIFFFFYFLLGCYAFGGDSIFLTGKVFQGAIKYPIRYTLLPFTFIIAHLYAFFYKGITSTDIFGSVWCFMAVAFGVVSCLHI